MKDRERRLVAAFATIPLLLMALVMVAPAIGGVFKSFDANGPSLANYSEIFRDRLFRRALANNLIVPGGSLAIEFALGLSLALFLNARQHGSPWVEAAAILPFAIPEIVLLTLARFVFAPRGYLNGALSAAGLAPLHWIEPNHALRFLTVMVVDAWHVTPVVMLIIMAGLTAIPQELYEAARIDGAGTWATFRHVTLPLLTPAIIGALLLRGVDALRIFATTLVLTGAEGVPVLSTYSYQLWSDAQEPNQAMAAAVILAVLVTILGTAAYAIGRKRASFGVAA